MTELTALCLALTAAPPSLEAVNAALAAGGDPNQSCAVEYTYRGYHFVKGEGLVSILIPIYGLGKLIFGGEIEHEIRDTAPLTLAVRSRDPAIVHALTRAGAALADEPLDEALDDALDWGRPDVVMALLADGAPIGARVDGELGYALLGVPGLWPALRAAGVSPDVSDGPTALERAVMAGDGAAARAFLAMGANPNGNPTSVYGDPLADAVQGGDLALARDLVAAGADVRHGGALALIRAARRGDLEATRWLLELGAPVAEVAESDTALYAAAAHGQVEILRLLLARGAPVDQLVSFERTALNGAASAGELEAARLLIEAGADVGHEGFFGYSPLRDAITTGQEQMVALLLGAGAPLTWRDGSPMATALACGNRRIVALLQTGGAAPRGPDAPARLSLHVAAEEGGVSAVNTALSMGAPIDGRDAYGRTALLVAAAACRDDVVNELLDRGARPDLVDDRGRGLGHAAVSCGFDSMVDILIERDFNLGAADHEGRTPVHLAVTDKIWVLDDLVAAGAPLNVPDRVGETPLHLALLSESEISAEEAVKELIAAGVSADLADQQGRTALDLAVARMDLDLVRLVLTAPHRAPAAPYRFDDDTFQWNFNEGDLILLTLLQAGLPVTLDGGPETAARAGKVGLAVALAEAGAPVTVDALGYALVAGDLGGADRLAARLPALDRASARHLRRLLRHERAPAAARQWLAARAP